jgi:hypothetical protein
VAAGRSARRGGAGRSSTPRSEKISSCWRIQESLSERMPATESILAESESAFLEIAASSRRS